VLPADTAGNAGFQWTSRKLAGAGFMALTLLTGVAAAAYLMGRMSAGSTTTQERAAEQFIVVDPPPVRKTPPVAVVPPAAPITPPAAASSYLQVAALDRGMADVSVEYLKQKGFEVRLGDGPTPGVFRVLVGPVEEKQIAATKEALEKLGFRPFLKRN
jgi:hypothetical protein